MSRHAASCFTVALLLLAGAPARGGYDALSRDADGYRPPAWLASPPAAPPPPEAPGAPDDEFEVRAREMRTLAASWERALAEPAPEDAFLVPDPALLARMKGIAGDDNAVVSALSGRFTLPELEVLALLRSPAAAAKAREAAAAADGYSQAESLDTLLKRYSSFTASLMPGVGPMESPGEMEAARFPWPGLLALKGQVVTQEVRVAREELEKARRTAVTAVRKAYREILWLREGSGIMETMHELLAAFRETAAGRYASGGAAYPDVVRVAAELEKVKEDHVTMGEELVNAEAMLREALALPADAPIGFPAEAGPDGPPPELAAVRSLARERRQEIRVVRAMIGKMERMVEMQETMILPPFTLGMARVDRGGPPTAGDGAMGAGPGALPAPPAASIGAGAPVNPRFGLEEGYLRELRNRLEALRSELRMEEAAADLAVRNAWFRLDRATREEGLYAERLTTLSRSALDASMRGYATGKVPLDEVIDACRMWLDAALGAAKAKGAVGAARAELEEAVGTSLPRRGGTP